MILRAISEIAVAIMVRSDPPKPISIARARPFWRAVTISTAELISTWISPSIFFSLLGDLIQVRQPLLQIQRGTNPLQGQSQLYHGKSHVRLNPNDHGLRPTQS